MSSPEPPQNSSEVHRERPDGAPLAGVYEVFHAALALPAEERAAFVRRSCEHDPALLAEVEGLLAQDLEGSFLRSHVLGTQGARRLKDALDEASLAERASAIGDDVEVGSRVGPYRVERLLGEGGMGRVWLAEQAEPIGRRVALKVIKPGMDSASVVARFEAERRILACMDHPGVARIHDAGLTPRGRPYFAMELVEGEPLGAFCAQHGLGLRRRLELMIRVCEAVQHAHQKGILHRDLKSSNVLVGGEAGEAQPRIIDFGVAKALHGPLADGTLLTSSGMLIGTPETMSPEQLALDGGEVDTRSDIYSLGVLLYELLTDRLPFDPVTLRSRTLAEIQRVIREVVPPRPSARLSRDATRRLGGGDDRTPASRRQARALPSDLDWITMRCLEKEPERRYPSASELAADLRRFLDHEPVSARPPSALYRARKFVRRHRLGTVAACVVVLSLVTGISISVASARRARRSEAQARREALFAGHVNEFVLDMLSRADPWTWEPTDDLTRNLRVVDLLKPAAEGLDGAFPEEPEVEARLRLTLGKALDGLGWKEVAEPHLARAAAILARERGPGDLLTLRAEEAWARSLSRPGVEAEARARLVQVLATRRRTLGPDHESTLATEVRLLDLREASLDDASHEAVSAELLERIERVLGRDHTTALVGRMNQALVWHRRGQDARAEELLLDLVERCRRIFGPSHMHTLSVENVLGLVLLGRGQVADAAELLEPTYAKALEKLGAGDPLTCSIRGNLAHVYANRGQTNPAEALYLENLDVLAESLGPRSRQSVKDLNNLATLYMDSGRFAEAETLLLELLEIMEPVYDPEGEEIPQVLVNLAFTVERQGRVAEAEELYTAALAVLERSFRDRRATLNAHFNLGSLLWSSARLEQALPHLQRAAECARRLLAPELPKILANLGRGYEELGRLEEAEGTFGEALDLADRQLGPTDPLSVAIANALAQLYERMGRPEDAQAHRR